MSKIYRKLGIAPDFWSEIQREAAKHRQTPNSWMLTIVGRYIDGTLHATHVKAPKELKSSKEPEEERVLPPLPPSAWEAQAKRIQDLQMQIENAEDMLKGYLEVRYEDPETGEMIGDDPDAPYIVETRDKIDELRDELHSIIPHYKEAEEG